MSYFAVKITDEWGTSYQLTGAGYSTLVVLMIGILLGACFIAGEQKEKTAFSTRQLVCSAMAMAIATVTSMIKVVDMPMGGSVTLFSMLFLTLTGYWYGLRGGMMTAIAYGFLQLILDPYIISIPQMVTDYILAFGALGLSGLFAGKAQGMVRGYLVGVLGRYFFSFLSGMIFFGSYASEFHMSAPIYSLIYNGAYLGLEAVLTLILISLPPVKRGLERIRQMAQG